MKYIIKDNNGSDYEIKDIKSFKKHIFTYHAVGTSFHEDNGIYFTVDDEFRKKLLDFDKIK
tara:strand:+ start:177 stop:359 length:183 start_codon:yes stop_codon:yes gene_type:complete